MGFQDELKRFFKGNEDEDEADFDELMPRSREERSREKKSDYKVANINTTTQLQVVLAKPERFENAPEIADHLKERRTVVVNLESTNKDVSRRILDFLSGVAYAREGQIKRVANSTYIVTPYNVNINGDLMEDIESSGVYF